MIVGRGIKVRLGASPGIFEVCRVAASLVPLVVIYFQLSIALFLGGPALEAKRHRTSVRTRNGRTKVHTSATTRSLGSSLVQPMAGPVQPTK